MKTFSINTLGCKVNQYESQQIRQLLENFGLTQVLTAEKADLTIVNTCCVTHTASAKSRQCIRKSKKLNPETVIIVAGCLPAAQTGELSNLGGKNIHIIKNRQMLTPTLCRVLNDGQATNHICIKPNPLIRTKNERKIKSKKQLPNLPQLPELTSYKGHTRAFLKVQDGCDGYCSYCIIPKTRPIFCSKPADSVLHEAESLVAAGHKEIVVTGVYLGAYNQKTVRRKNWPSRQNDELTDLLDRLARIANLERIRLSSLEPGDVTEGLLDVMCRHRNIMPHLHLSLQSGSDAVLARMGRQYGVDNFLETVESVKRRLDRPAITTDIIVGFPGETDEDFNATVKLANSVGFAKMHVFSFSARAGTAAAAMQPLVDNAVIKHRSQVLRQLDTQLGSGFRGQFIGEKATVLIENVEGQIYGRSGRYFPVQLEDGQENLQKNDLIPVELIKNDSNSCLGRVAG
ncbi:MAG: tRNA (N(6)-L-threonylcarbamoyladenosine(37)-C(2))-methylthiotransferase MtaB [Planctomycetota bacterium]|jgi:threonylcarbamoyladenosine tRNA methylthiotransferase MtaB